ncbi:membrane-bound transcription factor site-2 protease isoform X2 [Centruroides vittatus]
MYDSLSYDIKTEQILQPVFPGVNLPLSHVIYYFVTLLMCSIFHELGHALAAARENVKIHGSGLFIFGIFPGAFVDLSTESMTLLTPWQQLRIYCAGVWHNIVLVLCASFLLYVNAFLLFPFYQYGSGVTVTYIAENSGVDGPAGLETGDVITAIVSCSIQTEEHWKKCLQDKINQPSQGYCVPITFIMQEDVAIKGSSNNPMFDCCNKESQNELCFHHWTLNDQEKYSCLPVRKLLQQSGGMCKTSEQCEDGSWTCIIPQIDNDTRLLQLYRNGKNSVIFIGSPMELYFSVSVSSWIPRNTVFPIPPIQMYETFLRYVISFSSALAILNVVPGFLLDGFWITNTLMKLILPNFIKFISNRRHLEYFTLIIVSSGMLLLVINILLSLIILIMIK